MGMAFPIAMRIGSLRRPSLTAWFWAINGADVGDGERAGGTDLVHVGESPIAVVDRRRLLRRRDCCDRHRRADVGSGRGKSEVRSQKFEVKMP